LQVVRTEFHHDRSVKARFALNLLRLGIELQLARKLHAYRLAADPVEAVCDPIWFRLQ
jgi:hypothetical protein